MIWTPERQDLARASCRKWHGTPHQNRLAIVGVGIDCVKFLSEIIADAGIVERHEFTGYSVDDGMHDVSFRLCHAIEYALHVERINPSTMEFGAIGVFKTGQSSGHVGFLDGTDLWHSLSGQCVTHSQYSLWRHRIFCLYRLTDLGWKGSPQLAVKL